MTTIIKRTKNGAPTDDQQVLCRILIPKRLERALAAVADDQRTTVNEVIYDVLISTIKSTPNKHVQKPVRRRKPAPT